MMMRSKPRGRFRPGAWVLCLLLFAGSVQAVDREPPLPGSAQIEHHDDAATSGITVSRQQAARLARRQYGGRVLSVRLVRSRADHPFYRIKLLKDGRVRVVRIRADR